MQKARFFYWQDHITPVTTKGQLVVVNNSQSGGGSNAALGDTLV